MKNLITIIFCCALLSGCAYSRNVRDYFVDPAEYWSNKAIVDCRAAQSLREYHQRCLINRKRKLRNSFGELPENWQQVCASDYQALQKGNKQCTLARSKHSQALGVEG